MRAESSQMLTKVFAALRAEGVRPAHVARDLSLSVEDVNALTFMLKVGAVS